MNADSYVDPVHLDRPADVILTGCSLTLRNPSSSDQRPSRTHRDSDDPLLGQGAQLQALHERGPGHHEPPDEGTVHSCNSFTLV